MSSETQSAAATVNDLTLGIERAVRARDLGLVNLLRRQISNALGVDPLPDLVVLPERGDDADAA